MSDEPRIDHVGIAVEALADAEPLFRALLGEGPDRREQVPGEGVEVSFFGGGPGRVELLEPVRDDSPVGRFLDRHGPGVHHVCLRVGDLEAALRRAGDEGAEPIPPPIRRGAGGSRVAFLHPRSTGGVLVELTETGSGADGGGADRGGG